MQFNRILTLSATVLAMWSLAPVIKADATADARKVIQANYNKADSAMARKDVNTVIAMYTPDAVSVSKEGKEASLADLKTSFGQLLPMAKSIKSTTTIEKLVLKGKEAFATIKEHAEILLSNPKKPSGSDKYVADATGEDTWVQTAKGWLIKKSKNLTMKQFLNGTAVSERKK